MFRSLFQVISVERWLLENNKLDFEESVRATTSLYEGERYGKQEVVDDILCLAMAMLGLD